MLVSIPFDRVLLSFSCLRSPLDDDDVGLKSSSWVRRERSCQLLYILGQVPFFKRHKSGLKQKYYLADNYQV